MESRQKNPKKPNKQTNKETQCGQNKTQRSGCSAGEIFQQMHKRVLHSSTDEMELSGTGVKAKMVFYGGVPYCAPPRPQATEKEKTQQKHKTQKLRKP